MTPTLILTMPTPLREKLGKLIALFGSPVDGEKLSAVNAMERTLGTEGLDFNSLAEFIGFGQQLETSDLIRILTCELRGRLQEVLAGAWALSETERQFTQDYEQRLGRGLKTTTWHDYQQLEALCRHVRRRTGKRN